MRNNNERLREQNAPEKNTDKAFVKVDKDGSPSMPGTSHAKEKKPKPRRGGKPA